MSKYQADYKDTCIGPCSGETFLFYHKRNSGRQAKHCRNVSDLTSVITKEADSREGVLSVAFDPRLKGNVRGTLKKRLSKEGYEGRVILE